MKFIVKTNLTLKQAHIKQIIADIEEMLKKGVVVLDGKFEYPPIIIDDGEPPASVVIKTKIKKPAAGEHFEYNGIEFVSLGEEQGGVLAIVSEFLEDEMPLDESNKNDWRTSSLRKYLNGEYLEQFNRGDLLPFVSNLTADNGMKDYGTAEDYVFLLSCDLYRKYRESVPRFNNWWWTLTPWTCTPSLADSARIVVSDGTLDHSSAYISYGVAHACLFNPKIFE